MCDLRARHVGATGLGTEFSLSGGSHPIDEILPGPSVSGAGKVAYDFGGAIDMVSGTRLWSKAPTSFPLPTAVLENGRTLYAEIGAVGPVGTIFDQTGVIVATNQPVLVEWDGSPVPSLIDGDTQVGWLPDRTAFAAAVAAGDYVEPEAGFPMLQGGPRRTNSPLSCEPHNDWYSPVLATPRDYVFAFDDEVPGFPSAGSQGTFTGGQKDLFWPAFLEWQFPKGFPKSIDRWTPGNTIPPNLVIRKADLAHAPDPKARNAHAVAEHPGSVFVTVFGPAGASFAVERRTKDGVPDFPVNKFGIFVKKTLTTSSQLEIDFFTFVAVHEFGHIIGVGHADKGCRDNSSVMIRVGDINRPFVTAPTEKDKAFLRKLLNIK